MKKLLLILAAAGSLSACAYGDRQFVSNQSVAEMQANSRRVQDAERAERTERRAERREEMMNAADAIKRANEGSRVYLLY